LLTVVVKARIVEIAEDRLIGRVIHGKAVVGRAPQFYFRLMAFAASLAADKGE